MITRKVILDVDPGIDDAVALTLALFHPGLEVLAVTAVGGNVSPEIATRNVQIIIEQLDPPRWPRMGAAVQPERPLPVDATHLFGSDGLGNADFACAELHNVHPSDKVIVDTVRAAPHEVTLIALGPLTNVANVLRRDPDFANLLGELIIMGGAFTGSGNITPAAEFNIYCDPAAARSVLRSPMTMTMVPLEVTSSLVLSYDFLDGLPAESSRAGRFLRKILPHAYRAHRQRYAREGITLDDAVALVAGTNRELFETKRIPVDVETRGLLTMGATVSDRRPVPEWRPNVEVATDVDLAGARDVIVRGLQEAGRSG